MTRHRPYDPIYMSWLSADGREIWLSERPQIRVRFKGHKMYGRIRVTGPEMETAPETGRGAFIRAMEEERLQRAWEQEQLARAEMQTRAAALEQLEEPPF